MKWFRIRSINDFFFFKAKIHETGRYVNITAVLGKLNRDGQYIPQRSIPNMAFFSHRKV